jgi:hypothetical protein
MICQKCGLDFPERLIETSHDIPKYMGGTDKDGRHNLCANCHEEYEKEVSLVAFMNLVKSLPENMKKECRKGAWVVQQYFFKEDKKDGTTD